jgi:uncharacterized protein YndB with AHSA1/START domain
MTRVIPQEDFARMQDGRTLVIQRWLPGPIERVWSYLADGDLRRQWLAAGEMELAPGAPVELVWRNDVLSAPGDCRPSGLPEVQVLHSRVIEVDPPHRLVIAWGQGEVSFSLTGKGDRVLLAIRHSGLDRVEAARLGIPAGWHMHLEILKARLSGGDAPSFWSGWTGLRAQYQRLADEMAGKEAS